MKNSANLTIVLLSITAAILGGVVVGTYTSDKAYADAGVKQGDYAIAAMQVSDTQDILVVADLAARRMNTYVCRLQTMTIELVDNTVDLDKAFR